MGMHQTVWLALVLLLAGADAPPEAEAPATADVQTAFTQAFAPEVEPQAARLALERIVKESPDSEWADDALWVLGEHARQGGQPLRVAYYWQYLMAVRPEPHLEEFTRSLPLYRWSGLVQVEIYVRKTGQSYALNEGRIREGNREFLNVKAFNPVPMLVWAGLGSSYEQMDRLALSLKAFQQAQASAPTGGPWRASYEASARRVQMKLSALGVPPQAPGTPTAAPQPAPQQPAEQTAVPAAASTSPRDEALERSTTE